MMKDFEKKKEVIDSLVYKLESDYTKRILKEILKDLEHYDRITRHTYFYLQDTEAEQANEFYDKHVKGRYFGAIGGGMTYSFTPTVLGDIIKVKTQDEDGCVIEKDITDVLHW